MAWIESHQSLLSHKKTLRASAKLKVSKILLIGHLHVLWWWCLDNAKDNGDLGDISNEELADAAGWPVKKASEFVSALLDAHFIDQTDRGYALHNWYNYAGKLNEKRAKDRARKAEVAGNSSGIPTEVAGKSQAPTNPPTNLTNTTNQPSPTGPAGGRSAKQMRYAMPFDSSQITRLYEQHGGTKHVDTRWKEFVVWREKDGVREPDDLYAAFIGFLRKQPVPSMTVFEMNEHIMKIAARNKT